MLKKRIIPCLDIRDGRTVKGVNFLNIIDAGDPVELAKKYVQEGADELIFLDITASVEKRKILIRVVENIAAEINIPFTVGGGVSSIKDAADLLKAGADKISINSAAVKNPVLISNIAARFGSQCVVVAIDAKKIDDSWKVAIKGGRELTDMDALHWAKEVEKRGAGELLLTSMDQDGMKNGFAIELNTMASSIVNIPVIASGGAGKKEHFLEVFRKSNVSAALAASVFHFAEIPIPDLKIYLQKNNIEIR